MSINLRAIIFLLLGLLCYNSYSQNYWIRGDKFTTKDLKKIFFLNNLTGWTAGDSGAIFKTIDGGQNWTAQETEITQNIVDIFWLNDSLGWALAHDLPSHKKTSYGTIILKTTNGGTSWEKEYYPDEENFFFSIVFLDSLHGWMGGEFGKMVGTTDGGRNWFDANVITPVYPRFAIRKIKFLSKQYGYGVGGIRDIAAVIWRTTTGGSTWTVEQIGSEPLYDLHFIDSSNILCFGGDFDFGAGIVKTTDAGLTWDYNFIGIWGEGRGVSYRTKSEGWVSLGFSGTCMYTRDSGNTWTDIYTPDTSAVYDVVFTDKWNGFMVGINGTFLKYNSRHYISVKQGWNLISLPAIVDDGRLSVLFPTARSNAFTYTQMGYLSTDSLITGAAYWIKFPADEVIQIIGAPIFTDMISVKRGWNIIGAITNPVPTSSIKTEPPEIISSNYFGYDNGYLVSDTLKPGKGYWVKVSVDGKIILNGK